MIKISELRHQRAEKVTLAGSLLEKAETENRSFTPEEDVNYRALEEEIKALGSRIEYREGQQAIELESVRGEKTIQGTAAEDEQQDNPPPKKVWRRMGEQLQAVARADSPGHRVDPRLIEERASGMNEGIPSEGGFVLQADYSDVLLQKTYKTTSLAARCFKLPLSANSNGIKLPYIKEDDSESTGIVAYWKGEAAAKTGTKPEFRTVDLSLKKLTGLCYITDELLQDAAALETYMTRAFTRKFSFKLDDAILNGLGAGQPLGILNAPCLVTVAKETGQMADTIVFENIVKMWSRLSEESQFDAVWLINKDVEPQLFSMGIVIGTGGSSVYLPPGGLSGSQYGTLFGRPVIKTKQCATIGDKGDIVLVDCNEYVLIEKGGIQAASSIHLRFNYDETAFRFVYRVDGRPWESEARAPYKGTNSSSPFVTLAERA